MCSVCGFMIAMLLVFLVIFKGLSGSEGVSIGIVDEPENCRCIASHLCSDNDATANGQGLLDIRFKSDQCENYFEVCCENIVELEDKKEQITEKGCGYQNIMEMGPRITSNSQNSLFGELPWSIVILQRDPVSERNMYRCGGSLIHRQVVLTAAHCVFSTEKTQLTIRAGEWNTRTQDEPLPHQDRKVQEVIFHPQYHSGSLKNDIALLFLSEPVDLADNIAIICLPPKNLIEVNSTCIASGWGKDAFRRGKHSSILKKVDLPLIPRDECLTALRNTRLGKFYNLHKSFICAGGEKNKDTCKGDGGSPLVCPLGGGRFFQVGIVSWGIGCGENETPGVYVNLALFVDWIDKQMFAKDMDLTLNKL